ncbi:GL25313 [Drosophila persimilis]|uniref:GL25313 n=1 Tax=Drosophila persimilis TaxID=7234 RepID=B4GS30_DROPE|nr:GL25313 [Drosophila persimilis]
MKEADQRNAERARRQQELLQEFKSICRSGSLRAGPAPPHQRTTKANEGFHANARNPVAPNGMLDPFISQTLSQRKLLLSQMSHADVDDPELDIVIMSP